MLRLVFAALCSVAVVLGDVAQMGGCYGRLTNTVTCDFNSTFCQAPCLIAGDGQEPCREFGDVPAWKTPRELRESNFAPCYCQKSHVGSCYTVRTDHTATCHLHRSQCPADTIWIPSGYRFGAHSQNPAEGTYCMCHDNRGIDHTQYGVCKKGDIQSRCSIDAGHCEPDETWIDPQEAKHAHGIECASYNVEVGACKAPGGSTTCVVDADSCSPDEIWVKPSQARADGLDCKLDAVGEWVPPPNAPAPTERTYVVLATVVMPWSLSDDDKVLLKKAISTVCAVKTEDIAINIIRTAPQGGEEELSLEVTVKDAETAGEVERSLQSKESLDYELDRMGLPMTTKMSVGEISSGALSPGEVGGIVVLIIASLAAIASIGAAVWTRKKIQGTDNIFLTKGPEQYVEHIDDDDAGRTLSTVVNGSAL